MYSVYSKYEIKFECIIINYRFSLLPVYTSRDTLYIYSPPMRWVKIYLFRKPMAMVNPGNSGHIIYECVVLHSNCILQINIENTVNQSMSHTTKALEIVNWRDSPN